MFGRPDRYALSPTRPYTPPAVYLDEYLAMHEALGVERGVIVQSGVHGTDNRALLDAIATRPERLRGIALIRNDITDEELDTVSRGGVVGFRSNLVAKTGVQLEDARKLAARVARLGWHVQFLLDVESFPDLDEVLGSFPTQVVIDHMGRPDVSAGTQAPGFQALIRLLKTGKGWTKLSAPYRTSRAASPYADLRPFAQALVESAPDRLVWGTDWPHVMLPEPVPNTGELTDELAAWVPDEATRSQILVTNPERLYGFG
ncbi:amidohydrolase family protein [Micromonospora sp. STR1s_5]|nr:amidohydrolase family protein [Micromonospora sp. STR1s_5]